MMIANLSTMYKVWELVITNAQALSVIISAILVTVSFWELRHLRKDMKVNTIKTICSDLNSVNQLILQDVELAHLLNWSKEDSFAAINFSTFMLQFFLHQEGLTNDRWWEADKQTIKDVLGQEFMHHYWERYNHQYPHTFRDFITNELAEKL